MLCLMLTNEQRDLIKEMFPPPAGGGRPRRDPRIVLEGILRVMRTGIPWRDLPTRFPRGAVGPLFRPVAGRFFQQDSPGVRR